MKVGIAGFGTIGRSVGRALDRGIGGLTLDSVTTRTRKTAEEAMIEFSRRVPIVDLDELVSRVDVVVECAPKDAFRGIAETTLRQGRILVTVSGAGLVEAMDLVELAREMGGRIILATGAILGLDAIRAAAEGNIHSVTMVTRKPPSSLVGAPYLKEQGIALEELSEPMQIFEGTARDGARGFPSNVNVAAAVGLAGIGADKTRLEIWADPTLTENTHRIVVHADSARFEMQIRNSRSEENPGTGKLTALSVIATLRSLVSPLRVGT